MTESTDQPGALRAAIERWLQDHIANSPVSRSVEALNHLRGSLDHLEAEILAAIIKEI